MSRSGNSPQEDSGLPNCPISASLSSGAKGLVLRLCVSSANERLASERMKRLRGPQLNPLQRTHKRLTEDRRRGMERKKRRGKRKRERERETRDEMGEKEE